MDADTVGQGHEKILREFQARRVPILLGTQMVAKGLDFANVTLVGVLAADLSLYVDHYRAAERTFSLLTQVVGRAGRGEKQGRAVIQTYTPRQRRDPWPQRTRTMTAFTTVRSACGSCGGTRPLPTSFIITVYRPRGGPRCAGPAAGCGDGLRPAPRRRPIAAWHLDSGPGPGAGGEGQQSLPLPGHGDRPQRQDRCGGLLAAFMKEFSRRPEHRSAAYLHRLQSDGLIKEVYESWL